MNYIGDYDYYLDKKEELTEKYAPSAQEATEETKEETAPEQDAEQEVWDACAQKEDGDEE